MLAFRQTPQRRELDYLRLLAASKETAKELRLFGLSWSWTNLFRNLFRPFLLKENIGLNQKRRLIVGLVFSLVSTCGYYAAYIMVIHRTVSGQLMCRCSPRFLQAQSLEPAPKLFDFRNFFRHCGPSSVLERFVRHLRCET